LQPTPPGTPNEWKATVIGGSGADIQEFLEEEWSEEISHDDGLALAVRALRVATDELGPEEVSIATLTDEDGYHSLGVEEIEAVFEDADIDLDAGDEDDTDE